MSPGYRYAHSARERRGDTGPGLRREKIRQKVAFRQTRLHTRLEKTGDGIRLSVKPVLDQEQFGQSKALHIVLSLMAGVVAGGIPYYFISSSLSAPDPLRRLGSSFFIVGVGLVVFYLLTRRHLTSAVNLEVKGGRVTNLDSSRSYPPNHCSVQLDENVRGGFFYLGGEVLSTFYLGQDDFGKIAEFTAAAGIKTERLAFDADRPEPF